MFDNDHGLPGSQPINKFVPFVVLEHFVFKPVLKMGFSLRPLRLCERMISFILKIHREKTSFKDGRPPLML